MPLKSQNCCLPFGEEVHQNNKVIGVQKVSKNLAKNLKTYFPLKGITQKHYICLLCNKKAMTEIKKKQMPKPCNVVLKRGSILDAMVQGFRRRSPNTTKEAILEIETDPK